jgi:hypothetical protein
MTHIVALLQVSWVGGAIFFFFYLTAFLITGNIIDVHLPMLSVQ